MKRSIKRISVLFAVMILGILFAMPVFADFGPKPSTTIYIENPPDGVYYLDLLIPNDGANQFYSNLNGEVSRYDDAMLELLRTYGVDDDWHTALTVGTRIPLFGRLTGTPVGGGMEHTFSYFGTPNTYRILVVTDDLTVYVSDVIKKQIFQERLTVRLDHDSIRETKDRTGSEYPEESTHPSTHPSENKNETGSEYLEGDVNLISRPSKLLMYLYQFALTFVPTIVVELGILLLFRIPVKKNLLAFFLANFVTQVFMTVIMTSTLCTEGVLQAYFLFVPIEFLILAVECAAYAFSFRDVSRKRAILYGAVANVVSAALGFLLLGVADSFINFTPLA